METCAHLEVLSPLASIINRCFELVIGKLSCIANIDFTQYDFAPKRKRLHAICDGLTHLQRKWSFEVRTMNSNTFLVLASYTRSFVYTLSDDCVVWGTRNNLLWDWSWGFIVLATNKGRKD